MRAVALVPAVALLFGVVSAQSPTDPRRQTFRTSTRLVQVSVVVHDDRNRPIEGLRAADFQVFEDGHELPLAFFSVRAHDPARAMAAVGDDGTFTNRIPSPANGGVVAILFDQLNTAQHDQAYARAQLLRFLETIDPDDRVALYVSTADGLKVLYDFTRDAESLVKALRAVSSSGSRELALSQPQLSPEMMRDLSAFARGVLAQERAYFERLRGEATIGALERIAARLSGVPGRKNLVWISAHFPFLLDVGSMKSAAYMTPDTRRVARALNDSDTAVYPIDTRGLIATPQDDVRRLVTLKELDESLAGLRVVADWTGGRMFAHDNDIAGAISRAVEDSRTTYMLGYYPVARDWDGRFRRIEVRVRRSGVRVRHRAGYYAFPLPPADTDTRAKALDQAAMSPLEATGVLMDVQPHASGAKVTLAIELDPTTVLLNREGARWTGGLDFAIVQTQPGEQLHREPDFALPLSLTDAEHDRLMKEGIRLTRTIQLRSDAQQVRVVVRDAASGMVGSVFIDAERLRLQPATVNAVHVPR